VALITANEQPWPITYEILAYLAEHPDAQDTLEGVMRWWLLERQLLHWQPQVEAALAELVEQGLILAQRSRGGRTHYRFNQQRLAEIKTMLEQRSNHQL
jgi:hypothetical protein